MRKKILLLVAVFFVFVASGRAQERKTFEPSVLLSALQLTFDGDVNSGTAGLGISYLPSKANGDLEIGLYGFPAINSDGGSYLGVGLHITFFRQFGAGIGVIPWREGTGVSFSGVGKRDFFFSVAYDLN